MLSTMPKEDLEMVALMDAEADQLALLYPTVSITWNLMAQPIGMEPICLKSVPVYQPIRLYEMNWITHAQAAALDPVSAPILQDFPNNL